MNDSEGYDERLAEDLRSWVRSAKLAVPSSESIRIRGTGRMRRRRVAAVVASVAAAAALIIGFVATSGPTTGRHPVRAAQAAPLRHLVADISRSLPPGSAEKARSLGAAEEGFATELIRELLGASSDQNVLVSPVGVAETLAQLELGAAGTTEQQLAAVTGSSGASARELAASWDALQAYLARDAQQSGAVLTSRDGVFVERSLTVRAAYLDALASDFGAGIWRADFRDDPVATGQAIDRWATAATHLAVPPLIAPKSVSRMTALVLANALEFDARWARGTTFGRSHTRDEPFRLASGATLEVPTMSLAGVPMRATASGGVTAVDLPYAGGKFSALVVEPDKGTLSSMLDGWSSRSLSALVSRLQEASVFLRLPRFSLSGTTSCNAALRELGLSQAYTSAADFSGITSAKLALSDVTESARIVVDERGTDVSAATGASVLLQTGPARTVTATFDRPFLFLIRDDATGAVVFEAAVNDPAFAS